MVHPIHANVYYGLTKSFKYLNPNSEARLPLYIWLACLVPPFLKIFRAMSIIGARKGARFTSPGEYPIFV